MPADLDRPAAMKAMRNGYILLFLLRSVVYLRSEYQS